MLSVAVPIKTTRMLLLKQEELLPVMLSDMNKNKQRVSARGKLVIRSIPDKYTMSR